MVSLPACAYDSLVGVADPVMKKSKQLVGSSRRDKWAIDSHNNSLDLAIGWRRSSVISTRSSANKHVTAAPPAFLGSCDGKTLAATQLAFLRHQHGRVYE